MVQRKTITLLILAILLVGCSKKFVKRSTLSRELAFSRVMVLPFVKSDGERSQFSELAQEAVIKELRRQKKFRVISFKKTTAFIEKFEIYSLDYNKESTFHKAAETLGVDTIIYGSASEDLLKLEFYSSLSGQVFYSVNEEVSSEFTSYSVKAVALLALRKLMGFIPYDALVSRAKNDLVEINVGSRAGVNVGMVVTVFDIVAFRPSDINPEHVRVPYASVKIVKVKRNKAFGRILKRNSQFKVKKYNKVSFLNFFRSVKPGAEEEF